MHNGELQKAIKAGDDWLKARIDPYYRCANENNSVLIVSWDEMQNHKVNEQIFAGLTDPAVTPTNKHDKKGAQRTEPHSPDLRRGRHQAGRIRLGQRHHARQRPSPDRSDVRIAVGRRLTGQGIEGTPKIGDVATAICTNDTTRGDSHGLRLTKIGSEPSIRSSCTKARRSAVFVCGSNNLCPFCVPPSFRT